MWCCFRWLLAINWLLAVGRRLLASIPAFRNKGTAALGPFEARFKSGVLLYHKRITKYHRLFEMFIIRFYIV